MIFPFGNVITTIKNTIDIFRTLVLRETNVFETMIVFDGIFNAGKFVKEYLFYTLATTDDKVERKQTFIKKCHRYYKLGYDDRYIVYSLMSLLYSFGQLIVSTTSTESDISPFFYSILLLFTIPYIQNRVVYFPIIRPLFQDFIETKTIFIKYTLSKFLIKTLTDIDEHILPIQNYQIFLLYDCLSIEYVFTIFKNYAFLTFLGILRNSQSTYYYYKAIKLSYYYNTGYLFNIIGRKDAVKMFNSIVKKKDWLALSEMHNVNIIYTLFSQRVGSIEDWRDIYIYGLKLFSVWSMICLLKLLNFWITSSIVILYVLHIFFTQKNVLLRSKIISTLLFYIFFSLNINDLIVSILFIKFDLLYNLLIEIVFFINQRRNIKKVVAYYSTKTIDRNKIGLL